MAKMVLKNNGNLHSLSDESIDIGELTFSLNQFRVPSSLVTNKQGIAVKLEKEKNHNGELIETGRYTVSFKVYDRMFVELVLANGGNEVGKPFTVLIENQTVLPNIDAYEDGEFVPITFNNGLRVKPKKVQKKAFIGQGKPLAEVWQYVEIKIEADSYVLGDQLNESKKQ